MVELWSRLNAKQKQIAPFFILAILIGVTILLWQSPPKVPEQTELIQQQARIPSSEMSLEAKWENELAQMLNAMLGIKGTRVFLTIQGSPELKIAYNITEEDRTMEGGMERRLTSTPVILRNDSLRQEMPLILEELTPQVRGVFVVIEGQGGFDLELQIAKAISTALQLPMYRIEVSFKQ